MKDKLQKRIRELVPSLMELSFGCEYMDSKGDVMMYVKSSKEKHFGILKRCMSKNTLYSTDLFSITIIGHPIHLASVLQAVYENAPDHDTARLQCNEFYWKWNWEKDNLNNQPHATIELLSDILIKE